MIRKYILITLPVLFLLPLVFFTSCEKEKVEPSDNNTEDGNTQDTIAQLNKAFYNLMNEWYYWYDSIPEINPENYENPRAILDEIRDEKDSYSYITSYEAFRQYYEEGAYVGYGFGYKWDADDSLRITFVFEDSPFTEKGIERGWAITEVNGSPVGSPDGYSLSEELNVNTPGVENTFTFKAPDGRTLEATFTSEEISMNTVLEDTVMEYGGSRVGYLVLKSFIDKTPDELTEAFRHFDEKNIEELIIDLRYNGGGTLSASRFLGEFIINNAGNTYVKISHNDKKSERDTAHVFGEDSLGISLGLNRTYFLTTQATASASEALINGMKPYMDVNIVGDTTYGKPVGMYAFTDNNEEYAFLPVCFKLVNAEDKGEYFDGLSPSSLEATLADDFKQPFGSMEDDLLYQALYHIENNNFKLKKAREIMMPRPANRVEYRSLQDEIGAL